MKKNFPVQEKAAPVLPTVLRPLQLVYADGQCRTLPFLEAEKTIEFGLGQHLSVLVHKVACDPLGTPGKALCEKPSKWIRKGKP